MKIDTTRLPVGIAVRVHNTSESAMFGSIIKKYYTSISPSSWSFDVNDKGAERNIYILESLTSLKHNTAGDPDSFGLASIEEFGQMVAQSLSTIVETYPIY